MDRWDSLLVTLAAIVAATVLGMTGNLPGEAVAAIIGGALPNPLARGTAAVSRKPVTP